MILRTVLRDRHDPADVEGQNAVWGALRAVDDPEYPGVSIVDLGLVEAVRIERGRVEVDLVPTFSGCPALEMIAADVRGAVAAIDGIEAVDVRFVPTPAWTPERITPAGRAAIAREFSVAVEAPSRPAECPRCGVAALVEESMFGPVRCRSIHVCRACGERIEVIR
jgi:ring-1,2-phenylacetyl-CoA epoxidase subunit PaaD